MSDEELYKAIKEYSEEHNLDEVRKATKILRAIKDVCNNHITCKDCPFKSTTSNNNCMFREDYPLLWEL